MAVGSAAIAAFASRTALMLAIVVGLVVARMGLWQRITRARGRLLAAELSFIVVCTLLGGFNDWNTVVRHGVYEYTVPVWFPEWSTIPIWMFLFWGLVLRTMASLGHALTTTAGTGGRASRWAGLGAGRLILLLTLVFATRQSIYRFALDPWLSWLPFAGALLVYGLVFGLDRGDRKIAAITLVLGPVVEILYINVAELHRYELGWIGGVPMWIVLWWVLAVLVWRDLTGPLYRRLAGIGCGQDAS